MKTRRIFLITVIGLLFLGSRAVFGNGFCVDPFTTGLAPPPPNGVWAYAPRNTIGWQLFYNAVVPPSPGRPWIANMGNTGNNWFNPGAMWPPMFQPPLLPGDNINALDTLGDWEDGREGRFFFSVDFASVGAPPPPPLPPSNDVMRVNTLFPGKQATSIFYGGAGLGNSNQWCLDGLEIGLDWAGRPGVQDELDAYDYNTNPNFQMFCCLDAASPSLALWGISAADVLWWDYGLGMGGMIIPATAPPGMPNLGLAFGDDIDALVYLNNPLQNFPNHPWAFSLAPGSPTLIARGWSAADIILSNGWGNLVPPANSGLHALALGLDPVEDNIDALDAFQWVPWFACSSIGTPPQIDSPFFGNYPMMTNDFSAVPEPCALIAMTMGITALVARTRLRGAK